VHLFLNILLLLMVIFDAFIVRLLLENVDRKIYMIVNGLLTTEQH